MFAARRISDPASSAPGFFDRDRPPQLWIDDGDGLLSDDADWDAETWALERPLLPRLQATLRCLCETLPEGFTFFAGWIGDDIQERQVECAELLDYVGRSRLSPHTRYRVRAH